MTNKAKKDFHFETALKELETLVSDLEKGELSLEDSLKHFEQGIALSRECQKALQQAKLKVDKLIEKTDGDIEETPL